ncbi:MaoC/PaaZ C-terminal domain-containing protein [Methylobacterium nonmethylotrophicum]|uniref:3-alpha,7-alpha, 12-alpha-trihydroxy-5-beta-cholest-24-enoyl-CoA hydratase n=1 Tax=Methylobacterium nonmethylotrophicum TaxID=1141884 RepID=A0A4Z0NWL4_9HYPH|nr:MaoC/PaaZ C-terminal domain-containing protein [Methylobacterium nonmethylotrophicum]TGE01659.1 3-alpha,7-alpha,12-alpha-trihydroxy-5-beta-cholest-24-enoyl-CoA hydratase [Methylobacterium nonmethylotrophicum]
MPFTTDSLMAYRIPPVRQRLTKRDSVFYALSVGFGQDPLDARQLDFVDADRPLKAVPTMPVVLAHPGFWMADPATGIDAVRVVHGEQRIVLHRTLPVEGEVIGTTRITGIVDKGAGRGALVYSEKEVREAGSGTLLATTRSTTFLRGDGGFGGPSGPVAEPHRLPDTPPDVAVEMPTRPEQALYYRLNGDDNPLHADPAVAAKAGFPRPILHGLCTLGVVGRALLEVLGGYEADRFRDLALRFSAPVYPGETIRVEIWRDGSFRALVPAREAVVINNGRAVFAAPAQE